MIPARKQSPPPASRLPVRSRADVEAENAVLRALVVQNLSPGCAAAFVAMMDREGAWPHQAREPQIWSCTDVAIAAGDYYEDGSVAADVGSRILCELHAKGIIFKKHNHDLCVGYYEEHPDDDDDPKDPHFTHEAGGYHCRCLVEVLPPEEWVPPPPRKPHQRRQPVDPDRACPHCGAHQLVATRYQCAHCQRVSAPGDRPKSGKRNVTLPPSPPYLVIVESPRPEPPPLATFKTGSPNEHERLRLAVADAFARLCEEGQASDEVKRRMQCLGERKDAWAMAHRHPCGVPDCHYDPLWPRPWLYLPDHPPP